MKKVYIIGLVNTIAFGSIFTKICTYLGDEFAWRIFIPMVIIFATNTTASLIMYAKKETKEEKKNDEAEE